MVQILTEGNSTSSKMLINLDDYERSARETMIHTHFDYYFGGSGDERTLNDNRHAFERLRLRPRVLVDVCTVATQTNMLATPIQMPIAIAPTAYMGLAHPEAECAVARAAAQAGTVAIISINANRSLEEIALAATGPLWQQFYLYPDRGFDQELLARIETAGYRALVLTVDRPRYGKRDRDLHNGGFQLPPPLRAANFANSRITPRSDDCPTTWQDIAWLRERTSLPLVLKGILTAEDAALAVNYGVDGIIVSNHGGRQLDGAIASIDALPEVVEAVDGRCEVYVDGGIRRGADVLVALALGARAVLVGRPILWGLAVNGEEGVCHVLELLRAELELAMALSGRPTLTSIDRSLITRY
jgi:4-hydroxymandelate oxidase